MERLIDLAKVIKQATKRVRNRIQISENVSSLLWEMLNVCFSNCIVIFYDSNPQEQLCLFNPSHLCFYIVVQTENSSTCLNHEGKWTMKSLVQVTGFKL